MSVHGKGPSFIIFKIVGTNIEVAEKGDRPKSWAEFTASITTSKDDGAYGVFEYDTEGKDGHDVHKLVFVTWAPETAPAKAKMLYAASEAQLKKSLGHGFSLSVSLIHALFSSLSSF